MDSFAAAAARLAGQAGLLFGWRPDEFWAATPAELAALAEVLMGGERLGGADVEQLKRMLGRGPSTTPAGRRGPPPRDKLGEDEDREDQDG